MAMSAGSSGGVNSDINVTPMIDVLLVLLIIFMVVIALGRTAMQIQIPPVETASKNDDRSNQIVLELRDDGTYWINGTQFTQANLASGIRQIYESRPAKLMFIKPGVNRLYKEMIAAMDVARGSGVEVIGVTPIEANGT
jgi:biopolymer transport protein ExbD